MFLTTSIEALLSLINVDYILFPLELAHAYGRLLRCDGQTPYLGANKWHWDLTELDSNKLAGFARQLFKVAERGRRQEKDVKIGLGEALRQGMLEKSRCKEKLLHALGPGPQRHSED